METEKKKLISIKAFADEYGVGIAQVYTSANNGELPTCRLGRRLWIVREAAAVTDHQSDARGLCHWSRASGAVGGGGDIAGSRHRRHRDHGWISIFGSRRAYRRERSRRHGVREDAHEDRRRSHDMGDKARHRPRVGDEDARNHHR